ncbi:hypothetical protein [Metabacillus sp. 84]|uniref:hypothetical protein n=1 Tax=Metabacillus sp. 84 TaxID=3404705 RepID=UPI003CEAFC24
MYAPNGSVFRTLKRGELIKVYGKDNKGYRVGGGYYIKTASSTRYYEGMVTLKTDLIMTKKGSPSIRLNKGQRYRVFGTEGRLLNLGGGYMLQNDKSKVSYTKN